MQCKARLVGFRWILFASASCVSIETSATIERAIVMLDIVKDSEQVVLKGLSDHCVYKGKIDKSATHPTDFQAGISPGSGTWVIDVTSRTCPDGNQYNVAGTAMFKSLYQTIPVGTKVDVNWQPKSSEEK